MRRRDAAVPAALVLLACASLVLVVAGTEGLARALVVGVFVAVAPGWAILEALGLARGWAGVAIAIALSLSLATIIPGALLYAGAWSPVAALAILAGLTVAASTARVARGRRA